MGEKSKDANMTALTPWFPADVKPVRVGVYQRKTVDLDYSYWNGKFWQLGATKPEWAKENRRKTISGPQKWRGLSADPSAKGGKR
jgi:hypothetical protein